MLGRRLRQLTAIGIVAAVILSACGSGVPPDADGPQAYQAVCARCHGDDLRGGIGPALVGPEADSLDKPESYFFQAIWSGIGRMPAFRRTLTDEQITLVSQYIIEQQGR